MPALRLKTKIYNLFFGILIAALVFFTELYLSGILKNVRLSPTLNYVVGSAWSLLIIAYLVRGAYRAVFGSVRDEALRHMVINIITLLAVLLTAELTGIIFVYLHYLFRLSIGYFVGFVIAYFILSMLINEALIYTYIKGAKSFDIHGSKRTPIHLVSDGKYGGYTISMLYHDLIILMHPEVYEGGVIEVINAHEDYHARYKHTVILNAVLFISVSILVYYGVRGYSMLWTALPLLAVLILILIRSFELLADKAAYGKLGPKSLDYFKVILKSLYGVNDPRRAPIKSRITHPGRRDLVLSRGDMIGAYAPWEFPLLASLVAGFLVVIPTYDLPSVYLKLALLIYVGVIIGSFLLTILLGVIFRPIVRLFSGGGLGDELVVNLSMMGASIFTMVFAASPALYLVYHVWLYSNITATLISFLLLSLVSWLALRSIGRAFMTAAVLTAIFIALNYSLYSVLSLVHALYMHVLFRG